MFQTKTQNFNAFTSEMEIASWKVFKNSYGHFQTSKQFFATLNQFKHTCVTPKGMIFEPSCTKIGCRGLITCK